MIVLNQWFFPAFNIRLASFELKPPKQILYKNMFARFDTSYMRSVVSNHMPLFNKRSHTRISSLHSEDIICFELFAISHSTLAWWDVMPTSTSMFSFHRSCVPVVFVPRRKNVELVSKDRRKSTQAKCIHDALHLEQAFRCPVRVIERRPFSVQESNQTRVPWWSCTSAHSHITSGVVHLHICTAFTQVSLLMVIHSSHIKLVLQWQDNPDTVPGTHYSPIILLQSSGPGRH